VVTDPKTAGQLRRGNALSALTTDEVLDLLRRAREQGVLELELRADGFRAVMAPAEPKPPPTPPAKTRDELQREQDDLDLYSVTP